VRLPINAPLPLPSLRLYSISPGTSLVRATTILHTAVRPIFGMVSCPKTRLTARYLLIFIPGFCLRLTLAKVAIKVVRISNDSKNGREIMNRVYRPLEIISLPRSYVVIEVAQGDSDMACA
jgi:hypothetical protein